MGTHAALVLKTIGWGVVLVSGFTPGTSAHAQLAGLQADSAVQPEDAPGLEAFSERFESAPVSFAADLLPRPQATYRFLYQAPGVATLFNQSTYISPADFRGVVHGTGRSQEIINPTDVAYVLSPQLLSQRLAQSAHDPAPHAVDYRVQPQSPRVYANPGQIDGRIDTAIDGRYDPDFPRQIDIEAVHRAMRDTPRRDPRLVERARRWREAREREAAQGDVTPAPEDSPDSPEPQTPPESLELPEPSTPREPLDAAGAETPERGQDG